MSREFRFRPFHALLFLPLLFFSSLLGLLVFVMPSLLLLLVSTTLHDRYLDLWTGMWMTVAPGFLELIYGMRVRVTGERFPKNDNCIIIMNHRTQMDWLVLWSYLIREGRLSRTKISLKNMLRHIPGAGWAMQQSLFLFLLRNWEKDKSHFYRLLDYYIKTNKQFQLLIFPEGTDYCRLSKQSSLAYAKKNNLQTFDYVLHPRTKGFAEATLRLRDNITSVIDITVGYPDNMPSEFLSLLAGNYPRQVHFDVKCYPIDSLPRESDELQDWCKSLWAEKEEKLKRFYQDGKFCGDALSHDNEYRVKRKLLLSLIFWTSLIVVAALAFSISSWFCWYILFACTIYGVINVFGGVQTLIINAFYRLNQPSGQY